MKTLTHASSGIVRRDPARARAFKAISLRSAGMTDAAIAKQLTAEQPIGSRVIITADDVWRMIRQVERQQRAE